MPSVTIEGGVHANVWHMTYVNENIDRGVARFMMSYGICHAKSWHGSWVDMAYDMPTLGMG